MIRLAAAIFFLILKPNGLLANQHCPQDEKLASECGAYCFSAMKPMLGYVKANQKRLDNCEKVASGENSLKTILQETLSEYIPQDLKNRLDKIEDHLTALQNEENMIKKQLTEIQETLSRVAKVARSGSKFYYIDEQPVGQKSINATNTCLQMGGKLATVQANEENGYDLGHLPRFK